ncbi:hypothetical protein LEMLEM_LOCUS27269, partial [Lemmus lemmus]
MPGAGVKTGVSRGSHSRLDPDLACIYNAVYLLTLGLLENV